MELIVIIKLKTYKMYQSRINKQGLNKSHWMVLYYIEILNVFREPNIFTMLTKDLLLHILWEISSIFLAYSQMNLISFEDLLRSTQINLFTIMKDIECILPEPTTHEEALVYILSYFISIYGKKENLTTIQKEVKDYDDKNLLDLKLQEFFVVNFTSIKVELHEYFKNLKDNKFPNLIMISNNLMGPGIGSLVFYNKFFAFNHDSNFKVKLAFILFEYDELIRLENVIKQILEKEDLNLQTDLGTIYKLAIMLFCDKSSDFTKALLYSKELLNIYPTLKEKSPMEESQTYFTHAFIYYKLSCEASFETKRVSMKSNAFDHLKISLKVVVINKPDRSR